MRPTRECELLYDVCVKCTADMLKPDDSTKLARQYTKCRYKRSPSSVRAAEGGVASGLGAPGNRIRLTRDAGRSKPGRQTGTRQTLLSPASRAFFTSLKESLFQRISLSDHLRSFQQRMRIDKYHLRLRRDLSSDTSLLIAGKSKPSTRNLQTKQHSSRCACRLVPAYLLLLASLFDTRPR